MIDHVETALAARPVDRGMSVKLQNWQRPSSRRKRITGTMSGACAVTVSSPKATA